MGQITRLAVPEGVDPEKFRHVIGAAYTAWIGGQKSALPDPDSVREYLGINMQRATVAKIMDSSEFTLAIRDRGVPWKKEGGLTARQMLALSVMTDPTNRRNPGAKLRAVGVSYAEYRGWLREGLFKHALHKITNGILEDNTPDMLVALTNKATSGDLAAIKFAFEMTGKHNPAQQEVMQLRTMVSVLMEIITRNVTDPVVLTQIATEIQTKMPAAITGEVL